MFKTGSVSFSGSGSAVPLFQTADAVPTTVTVSASGGSATLQVSDGPSGTPVQVPNPTTFENFIGSIYVAYAGTYSFIAHNAE